MFFTRISFSSRLPLPLRKSIDHAKACWDHCIGMTVHIAARVGSCSASDLGTSSPTIIARVVRMRRTITAEVDCGGVGLQASHALDQGSEPGRDRGLGVGAENEAGEGDADLRGGNVAIERVRVLEDRQHPRREGIAVLGQPSQPAPARAHDGELRRHEQRRQQDQQGDDP